MTGNRARRVSMTQARAGVSSVDRPNTIGLAGRELSAILDALDASEAGGVSPKREFIRWPFRHPGIQGSFTHPGGSLVTLKLAGRNISKGGLSVLHNAFVYPGTECVLQLPKLQGGTLERSAMVCRCTHRRGTLHELGLRFSTPIRLRDFVAPSSRGDVNSLERVDPSRLSGRVLYAGDNPLDAKIIAHFLRESSIALVVASSLKEGIDRLSEPFDILLIDWRLPGGRASDLLMAARDQGITTPAIFLAAVPGALSADPVWKVPGVRMLPKPFTQAQLLQDLGEVLLADTREAPSQQPGQDTLPASVTTEYAADLVRSIEKAVAEQARDRTVELCHQLRGCGAMLGMRGSAHAAERVCATLSSTASSKDEQGVLRELIAACRKDLDRLQDSPG
ncbi:MAG: hybrid sensor histidine kinase/response regulator [Leptolyngbya sp. PLA1]|nr:hybrid sensor histidine kinase/response regulator [Leptolyngbya sp. PLA1]